MRRKSVPEKEPVTQVVKNIRRATRRHFSAEDKIRIVLEGLRGEDSIAKLCRHEGMTAGSRPKSSPRPGPAQLTTGRGKPCCFGAAPDQANGIETPFSVIRRLGTK
jgi:hypothetical protein